MAERDHVMLELDGHEVRFSSPDKPFFPARGHTKLDLCEYYLELADACLRHLRDAEARSALAGAQGGLRG